MRAAAAAVRAAAADRHVARGRERRRERARGEPRRAEAARARREAARARADLVHRCRLGDALRNKLLCLKCPRTEQPRRWKNLTVGAMH